MLYELDIFKLTELFKDFEYTLLNLFNYFEHSGLQCNIHFFLFCILTEMLSSYAVPHRHQKIFKNQCLQSFKLNIEKSCWLCKARFTAYPNLASKHKLSNSFKTADT